MTLPFLFFSLLLLRFRNQGLQLLLQLLALLLELALELLLLVEVVDLREELRHLSLHLLLELGPSLALLRLAQLVELFNPVLEGELFLLIRLLDDGNWLETHLLVLGGEGLLLTICGLIIG